MLLLLHPRRLSAPVPTSDSDAWTWGETPVAGPTESDSIQWFDLGFTRKGKRNTLLSTWTSGVPSDVPYEDRL